MYKIFEPRIKRVRNKLDRLENNPAPTVPKYDLTVVLSKVLQARCKSSDTSQAYVKALFGDGSVDIDSVWISFDVAYGSDYINFVKSTTSPFPHFVSEDDGAKIFNHTNIERTDFGLCTTGDNTASWFVGDTQEVYNSTNIGSPIVANTWYHIDWHTQYISSTFVVDFFVNSINMGVTKRGNPDRRGAYMFVGVSNYSSSGIDVYIYYKNIKVGTSMGANDLFDGTSLSNTVWPFNDPSAPTAQLSVIDPPF